MRNIYLDNAATTQIAPEVLDDMVQFEKEGRGNPHRGLHLYAEKATTVLESARNRVASFIGATAEELVFTKSTTEGLNLAIFNFTKDLGPEDEVLYTIFDHHSVILPLHERSKIQGYVLKTIGSTGESTPTSIIDDTKKMIGPKTKLIVLSHVSNVLGTVLPVNEIVQLAKSVGAKVLVDGAQAVGHMNVDVDDIGCDAYAFSAHKMYGPMGIGALFVRADVTKDWKPLLYGGGMVEEVATVGDGLRPSVDLTGGSETRPYGELFVRYLSGPRLFEAGTPNVTGAFGFMAACHYVDGIGREKIQKEEGELVDYLLKGLSSLPSIDIFHSAGGSETRPYGEYSAIVSFSVQGMHPHDVAQVLSDKGIMVRAGNHCAAPLSRLLNEAGTVRVSFGVGNTKEDVDALIEALKYV